MAKRSESKGDDQKEPTAPAQDREQRIRELAYALWEKAGRPEGLPMEFWLEAEEAIDEGDPRENERSA